MQGNGLNQVPNNISEPHHPVKFIDAKQIGRDYPYKVEYKKEDDVLVHKPKWKIIVKPGENSQVKCSIEQYKIANKVECLKYLRISLFHECGNNSIAKISQR